MGNIACDLLDKARVLVGFTCIKTDQDILGKRVEDSIARRPTKTKQLASSSAAIAGTQKSSKNFYEVAEGQCEEPSGRTTADIAIKSSLRNSSPMMLMLETAESPTAGFDWVQLTDAEVGRVVGGTAAEEVEGCKDTGVKVGLSLL